MGERTANVQAADLAQTLEQLQTVIEGRWSADPESSYTARLLNGPVDYMIKKLAEEAVELGLAIKDDDHDHIRYEAADLIYHLLVALQKSQVSLPELAGELKARMK
ncbi:MAG: phosphoribosyl-ATP diphosphatase [Coriobacteriales bacterium]|jgi:phosphoribosyl-ATP pyrophosphohydrolase|nr:phosphoribosyl-ATP diphosphatase [Coriobacteriales bacterium]